DGKRDGDDEGVPETLGHGNPLPDQQRRYPIGKAVVADRLKEIERQEHDQTRPVGLLPDFTEFGDRLNRHFDRRRWRRQWTPILGSDLCLDLTDDTLRVVHAAFLREPT